MHEYSHKRSTYDFTHTSHHEQQFSFFNRDLHRIKNKNSYGHKEEEECIHIVIIMELYNYYCHTGTL